MSNQDLKKVIEKAQRRNHARKNQVKAPKSINDVFDRCSPHLVHPNHLRPYVQQLEKAVLEGNVHVCFHAPPQHGKSETAKHALVFYALIRPGLRHAYVTYNFDRAMKVRDQFVTLAKAAGLKPHASSQSVTLDGGTEIQFVGRKGGLTGNPIDGILIVDDIIKDDEEGQSPTIKEFCWNWWDGVADTRCHPGSSRLVMNTRWAVDDLPGRLIAQRNYPYIRLAAECDAEDDPMKRELGAPLWAEGRPLEWLQNKKINPRIWSAMWQGHPRIEGDTLFKEPSWYDELPSGPYMTLHGTDLAYTAKTRSDWSICLTGRLYETGDLFLTRYLRMQVQADVFTGRMAAHIRQNPGPVLWYGNSTERGAADLIKTTIPTFQFRMASSDKYVRATPTAEKMWNTSKVHLPRGEHWSAAFKQRVVDFTGEPGGVDDDVDALAALGDLAIQYAARYDGKEFNRRLRSKFRGHLRAV